MTVNFLFYLYLFITPLVFKVLQEGKFPNRNGIELHFMEQTSYDDELKPVLIVPALPESDMDYKDIIYILPNRTVCFTPRGRERSDAPETGYSIQDHANDIIDAINHFKLEELIVIAYSRGVTYFLQALPEIKDKLLGIILIDYPAYYEAHPKDWAKQYINQSWRSLSLKERFPKNWVLEKIEQESTELDLWDHLKLIKCPITLFIGGGQYSDPVLINSKITEESLEKYKSYLPQLKVVEFEESGHDLRLWEYEKFVSEIKNFIAEVTPKTQRLIEVMKKRSEQEAKEARKRAKEDAKEEKKQMKMIEKQKKKEQKEEEKKKNIFGINKEKLIKLD